MGISLFITFQVPLQVDNSIAYTSGHCYKHPSVNMELASLTCVPKFKYMMYTVTKAETQEY